MPRKKKSKKIKNTIISLVSLVVVCAIAVGVYYVYETYIKKPKPEEPPVELPTTLGEANVASTLSWNKEFNIFSTSVFYQYDENSINSYYKNIDFEAETDDLFSSLQTLLETNQLKVNYTGTNSTLSMSKTWANYCLTDRDYNVDNLTKEEVETGKWKMDGASLDILYRKDNLIFDEDKNGTEMQIDREHILPKSYGFNADGDGYQNYFAGCDLHNLRVSDHGGNSTAHNNRLYDDLNPSDSNVLSLDDPDGKSTSYYDKDKGLFMPPDEDKGEIARAIFYMATRYHNYEEKDALGNASPAIVLKSDVTYMGAKTISPEQTKDSPAEFGILSTLLERNQLDPVSENEMTRNNLVYNLQGNRNPFIDFPNLANILFA